MPSQSLGFEAHLTPSTRLSLHGSVVLGANDFLLRSRGLCRILQKVYEYGCSRGSYAAGGPPIMSRTGWKTVALAGLGGAVMIFILQRPPVLFTFTDPGEAMRPSVTVLDPLRDRAPEQVAEWMLTELREGDVGAAMARVHDDAGPEIVEKERQNRLRRWKLVDRIDGAENVILYYRVDRGAPGYLDSTITLFLCCRQRGWIISGYSPMY